MTQNQKCGFVSINGLPNAGKSTLTNALVGQKISIVSRKVQTTRTRVLGIVIKNKSQIIFIDTPGIFKPRKALEKSMVESALEQITEADIVLHLVDASARATLEQNETLIRHLPKDKPCYLILNKIDKIKRETLLPLAAAFNAEFDYAQTLMISSLKEDGLDTLLQTLADAMPESAWLFPEDQITDMPMRRFAAEITREKIFDRLHKELPYAIHVETESWDHHKDGSIKIGQTVYVQKESQKKIVLGKDGRQIKEISVQARKELEDLLSARVHLRLFVKLNENWASSLNTLTNPGI